MKSQELGLKRPREVYDYNQNRFSKQPSIPIMKHEEKIIQYIEKNKISIISGKTGCGKTTQVPKFIWKSRSKTNHVTRILMTQPRRIAAIRAAKRIAEELGEDIGKTVGYQVSMDSKIGEYSRILVKTTGIFLEELIHNPGSLNYTHVILDEVHERDVNIDLVLVMIKKLLIELKGKQKIKLILMSATISIDKFIKYFQEIESPLTAYKIEESRYAVRIYYVYEIVEELKKKKYDIDIGVSFSKSYAHLDERLFEVAGDVIQDIIKKESNNISILVFLPGIGEIFQFKNYLENNLDYSKEETIIYILHSTIETDKMNLALDDLKLSKKIILATNIAESSITLPNNDYVIDFCLTKEMFYNPISKREFLKLSWASKANCEQRAGRTGRVGNGVVFRLVNQEFYETLDSFPTPEIERIFLGKVVLKVKVYNCGEPEKILSRAITPPSKEKIANSITYLQIIGALTMPNNKSASGVLTKWGRIFSELPIDIKYSKMIMISYALNMIEPGIVIAAILSQDKKFIKTNNRIDLYEALHHFSKDTNCDFIGAYLLFKKWEKKFGWKYIQDEFYINQDFRPSKSEIKEENEYCEKNCLNKRVLRETLRQITDLKKRLNKFEVYHSKVNEKQEKIVPVTDFIHNKILVDLMKYIIAGAFYENIFNVNYREDEKLKKMKYQTPNEFEKQRKKIIFKHILLKKRKDIDEITEKIKEISQPRNKKEEEKVNVEYDKGNEHLILNFDSLSGLEKILFICSSKDNGEIKYGNGECLEKPYYPLITIQKDIFTNKELVVGKDSINCIIIEKKEENIKSFRYVTDEVMEKPGGEYLIARYTTKLPQKNMIDLLLLLIFSPKIKFFSTNQRYSSFKIPGVDKNFEFSHLFSSFDIQNLNEIRDILNIQFNNLTPTIKLPKRQEEKIKEEKNYIKKEEDEDINVKEEIDINAKEEIKQEPGSFKDEEAKYQEEIEEDDEDEAFNQKMYEENANILRKKFEALFNKKRCEVIKPYLEKIFYNFHPELDQEERIKLKQIPRKYFRKKFRNTQNSVEFLSELIPLDIEEDLRLSTPEGRAKIENEIELLKQLPSDIKQEFEKLSEKVNQKDVDVLCGAPGCTSFICTLSQLIPEQESLLKITGWVTQNLKSCSKNDPRCSFDPLVLSLKQEGFEADEYALCEKGKHLVGIKIKDTYYATKYSSIQIKYPFACLKEKLTYEMWRNQFECVRIKMQELLRPKEEFISGGHLSCKLCEKTLYSPEDFRKHLKSPDHIKEYNKVCEEIM